MQAYNSHLHINLYPRGACVDEKCMGTYTSDDGVTQRRKLGRSRETEETVERFIDGEGAIQLEQICRAKQRNDYKPQARWLQTMTKKAANLPNVNRPITRVIHAVLLLLWKVPRLSCIRAHY